LSTFAELAKMNVNEFTEKKGNLTYLSWAWAVDQLLRQDDTASWEYRFHEGRPYVQIVDTCMVFCTVKAFGKERTAQLPVMDYKNKAIVNPNAMEVNTAMQRCLAKAIALHGIGLYIYAGEDLPDDGNAATASAPKHTNVATDVWNSLQPSEQAELTGYAEAVIHELEHADPSAAVALLNSYNLDADRKVAIWSRFNSKERSAMKGARKTNGQ
jgi:hypothetical protein